MACVCPNAFRSGSRLHRPRVVQRGAAASTSRSSACASSRTTGEHAEVPAAQAQASQLPSQLCAAALTAVAAAAVASPSQAAELVADAAAFDASSAALAATILRPTFAIGILLHVVRIVMTWYPQVDGTKLPWAICYYPTEPVLQVTRKVVPLLGGVDVTPIVWVAILSFFQEILLGPQGILNLIQRQGGL